MIKKIKRTVADLSVQTKASIAYMLASVLTKGINILMLPIYTRLLSTSEMGIFSNFTVWFAILYTIVSLSLTTASMTVAMVDYEGESEKYQSVCLTMSTVSSLIFCFVYIFTYTYINELTTLTVPLMMVQIMLFMFNPALDSWYIRQRFQYKYQSVVVVSALISIISVIISLIAVSVAKDKGVEDLGTVRVVAQNSIVIIVSIFFWFKIMFKGRVFWNQQMVVYALKLSIPLLVHTLAKNILDASDRIMITKLCGDSATGIYGTVYNVSLIATIIWSAINSAIVPDIFRNLKEGKVEIIAKLTERVLMIMGGATIVATFISPEILRILTTKEYYDAVCMMPAILIGVYFTAVYSLYGNILMYYKKSVAIMLCTCLTAVINVMLNYIFISLFGYMAAAYTTFISFVILAVLQERMQFKVTKREVIPIKSVVFISIGVCIICLTINVLYKKIMIRYFLLAIIFIICLFYRRKLKDVLKL